MVDEIKMEDFPIKTKYKEKEFLYNCPDCLIKMDKETKVHSPTSGCLHHICKKCGLEYCSFYRSYWGEKPKNPKAVVVIYT